ncbi:MAG: hypothetical protein QM582_16295 [Micropruina sp.]|uniref:hypothetical protein n=1 Tax=Micropruina sp. TaxID=2737536 RepID=UPI0039E29F35
MTMLEERLRAGLRDLADDSTSTVELDRVIAAGNGRRSGRRNRQIVAGAAATAVALLGWYAVAPHPVTGVPPVPYASPLTAEPDEVASFGVPTDSAGEFHPLRVAVRRSGDQLVLKVRGLSDGRWDGGREYTVPAGKYATVTISKLLVLAVIPETTRSVVRPDYPQAVAIALPQQGLTLVATWTPRPTEKSLPLVWRGLDGTVRNSLSTVVPSARLSTSTSTITVFDDPDLHGWGIFPDQSQGFSGASADPLRAEVRLTIPTLGRAAVGLLPDGATEPALTPLATNDRYAFGTMPDGRIWYLIQHGETAAAFDAGPRRLVKTISYLDASGARVDYRPRLVG